ncbi:MAG: hypothetical protein U1F56_16205 [Rubrivivax sp.]
MAGNRPGRGAARFHLALADGLVQAAVRAAPDSGARSVALGGGCFFNRLLDRTVADGLQRAGLQVLRPQAGCGDAGLALGQAWATALQRLPPAAWRPRGNGTRPGNPDRVRPVGHRRSLWRLRRPVTSGDAWPAPQHVET